MTEVTRWENVQCTRYDGIVCYVIVMKYSQPALRYV